MVLHGLPSTLGVTLEMMILHGQAVRRGLSRAMMVVDMPFGSYEESPEQAFRNAARVMAETGAGAVKLEGGVAMAETIAFLVKRGIPVMAHVGLTPQSINTLGGYRVQGRGTAGQALYADAQAVARAGAFAVVLEKVPQSLADRITAEIDIPTIGIGASAGLRRTDSGRRRHAGTVHGLQGEIRETLCGTGRAGRSGGGGLCRRGARARLSGGGACLWRRSAGAKVMSAPILRRLAELRAEVAGGSAPETASGWCRPWARCMTGTCRWCGRPRPIANG